MREEVLAINCVRDVVTIKKLLTELASNWLRANQVVGYYVIMIMAGGNTDGYDYIINGTSVERLSSYCSYSCLYVGMLPNCKIYICK